ANSFARASFVAISALECLLLLAIAACIRSNARRVLARITSLQLTLINMRVGLCGTAHHMRDDCGKQSTLPEEPKRGRMKRPVAAGGSKQRMHSSEAGWRRLMLEIQALRDALGHLQSDTQPNRCHRPSGHR